MKPRSKPALAVLAFCILITSAGSSGQQAAGQAGETAKGNATAVQATELLGFRECMPFLFADKPEKIKEIRKKLPKWGYVKSREEGQRNIFAGAQNWFSEYEAYTIRILKLVKKAKANTNNEKLQEEINAQTKELHRIRGKWLSKVISLLKLLYNEHRDFAEIDSALSLLGEALWWAGKEKEGLRVLRGLIKSYEKSGEIPRAYMFFGEYYLNQGDPEKAREAFENAAVEKGHDCAPCATYRIALCHQLSGDSRKASEGFKKALSIAQEDSSIRVSAARSIRFTQGMVNVPEGWFLMGCNPDVDKDCSFNEKPGRKVYLDEFWIDRTEVTAKQYKECVRKGGCSPYGPQMKCGPGKDPNHKDPSVWYRWEELGECPVRALIWEQAKGYCEWAGKRLPTEAEWEKAARGTEGRIYPWGNEGYEAGKPVANIADKKYGDRAYMPPIAKHDYDDGFPKVAPTGIYPQGASPYGALDMVGNAWEWVADWYRDGYDKSAHNRNPKGPKEGKYRVIRGCSFADLPKVCRASARFRASPKVHKFTIGFRCAANPVK